MMTYDKTKFKAYYGGGYITGMRIEALLFLVGVALRLTGLDVFIGISAVLVCFMLFVFFPFTYCYYLRAKNQAQRQKQWIDDGKLYVERCYDNGFTAGGFVHHKETMIFDLIDSFCVKRTCIEVKGSIQRIETYNGVVREKALNKYRIPRCFTNEEQILKLAPER